MAEIDPVILQLRADVARYNAEIQQTTRRVTANLDRQERSIVGLENQFARSGSAIAGVAKSMGGALAGISVVALARSFLDIADSAKQIDAQLRLATATSGSFAKATDDVRRIAGETRSGLEETASLYGNFARGVREVGGTQAEAARATETFSKTLKISGADAGQAASATLQFGQALASGALRGDELNSILEASPRLARLLTDSLGVPIGKIKELGEAGALTSDKLLAALTNQKFTKGIDDEFRQLPVTFDEAMAQVSNAAIITFGAFDRGGAFSTALANFITDGTDGFADLEQSALETGIDIRSTFEGLADAFEPFRTAAEAAFGDIENRATTLSAEIRNLLSGVDAITQATRTPLDDFIDRNVYGLNPDEGLVARYDRSQQQSVQSSRNRLAEQYVQDLSRGRDPFGNLTNPAPPRAASGPSDKEKKAAAAAARRAATAAAKAERERLSAIREEGQKERELTDIQGDLIAARAALARASEDILQYALDELDNRQTSRQQQLNTDRKLGDLTKREYDDRSALLVEETNLRKEAVRMRAAENARQDALDVAQASKRDDQDILAAQAALVEARQERRDIELRLLDLAVDQERAELEGVIASNEATEAQKQIAQQRLRILDQLKGYDAERINRDTESPLDRRRREVRETAANMGDVLQDIELDAVDRLTDGIADASTEFIKLGGVAGDVLNGILNDLIRLSIQQAIFGSGGAGSGGGLLGTIGGLFGGARAKGGPVTGGKTYLVGEEGPELFRASSSGSIVPNNELVGAAARGMVGVSAASPVAQQTGTIRVMLSMDNDVFTARVQEASIPVAVEVVRQSGPGMVQAAKAETLRTLSRPGM